MRQKRSLLVAVVSAGLVSTGMAVSAPVAHATTVAVSPVLTGVRASATRVPFPIDPELSASVDVGTGNLLVTTTDLRFPTVGGGLQSLGLSYNSLTLGSGSATSTGLAGRGWFMPMGSDTRLIANSDGSVLFMGPDSQQGLFTVSTSGSGYNSPASMNMSLTKNSDGTWQIIDLPTRQVLNFNSAGRLTSAVDRNGNTTTFTYNSSGQLADFTNPFGEQIQVSENSNGTLAGLTYPQPFNREMTAPSVSYGYDSSDRLTSITSIPSTNVDPVRGEPAPVDTTLATFTWSSAGDLASITDAVGNTTSFTYDSSHRVTQVSQGKDSDQAVTRFDYVSSTQTDVASPTSNQSQTVPTAAHTTYTLNSSELVTSAVDPLGRKESASYTPFNAVASSTNGVGGTTSNTYGANSGHSITQSSSPTGASSSAAYQGGSGTNAYEMNSSTDSQGNSSTMTYDGHQNPTSTTTGTGGAKAQVTYNSDGTIATSTDPAGHVTTYTESSSEGYIAKITPPAGSGIGATTISGVPATSITNGAGQTTTYTYDQYENMTSADSTDLSVSYTYDNDNRLIEQADNNQKILYTYNDRGQITSIATIPVSASAPPASTVSYSYDLNGNMTSRTIGSDTTTYTYDADNELTSMTTGDGKLTQFAYDADGNRTDTWWHTNAANTTFAAHTHNTFDSSGRITQSWTSEQSDSNKVENNSYSYSLNGKDTGLIQSITNNLASSNNVSTLKYDSQNRLISATNWNGQNYTYTYDIDGNRTTTVTDGKTTQSLTFNTANEISSSGYTYDAAGRRTKDPSGGTIKYNSAGQAISQTTSSGTDTMTYAGTGQDEMIRQNASSAGAENYIYGRSDQSGTPTLEGYSDVTNYVVDNDAAGEPIDSRQTSSSADLYYAYDGLGRDAINILAQGSTVETFEIGTWDPYGDGTLQLAGSQATKEKLAAEFGTRNGLTASAASSSESPWTTQGIESYIDAQWYKRGARWNDTTTGTWTSVDPITKLNDPNNANPYAYAGDDPINMMDPNGQDSFWDYFSSCAKGALTTTLIGYPGQTKLVSVPSAPQRLGAAPM